MVGGSSSDFRVRTYQHTWRADLGAHNLDLGGIIIAVTDIMNRNRKQKVDR